MPNNFISRASAPHPPAQARTGSPRRRVPAALAALLTVVMMALGAAPAPAVELNQPLGNMLWGGYGFVYVAEGETISLALNGRVPSTYAVARPDGSVAEMRRADGTTAGPACATNGGPCLLDEVATSSGVWRITGNNQPEPFSAGSIYSQVIRVLGADGVEIPGRFFVEQLAGYQHRYGVTDLDLWVMSEYGSQYRVEMLGFSGYGTVMSFNNLGVMNAATCESAYVSAPIVPDGGVDPNDYTVSAADCPNLVPYRIFVEQPDPGLPAQVGQWADGRTTSTWLNPAYEAVELTDLMFTPSGTATQAGEIAFTLVGQPGTVTVGVDVDGDGELTGPRDVVFTPVAAGEGESTIPWDGLDGEGAPVPATQAVRVLASYTGQDELHLTQTDTEGLFGGIRLEKLTGPDAGSGLVSWDDSLLMVRPVGDNGPSNPRVGTDVDSLAGPQGVRGWTRPLPGAIHGWGDGRNMDTWTRSNVAVEADVVVPARAADLAITKTADATTADAGDVVTFTVEVTNDGTADVTTADAVVVTDDVVSGSDLVAEVTGVTTTTGTAAVDGTDISWSIPALAAGATATLTYDVRIGAAGTTDRAVDNWAFVGSLPQSCTAAAVCADASVVVTGDPTDEPTDPTDPPTDPTDPPTDPTDPPTDPTDPPTDPTSTTTAPSDPPTSPTGPTATSSPTATPTSDSGRLASTGSSAGATLGVFALVSAVAGALVLAVRRRMVAGSTD